MKKCFLPVLVFFLSCTFVSNAREGKVEQAIFAMGCFWCGESAFTDHDTNKELPGIFDVIVGYSGYSGKDRPNPTYKDHRGYKEVVHITFDPKVISYQKLLDIFWRNIDPFDDKGQFCDKGASYTSAIYYLNDHQKKQAEQSKEAFERKLKASFVTEILQAEKFYDAEEYHQDYKKKNPWHYRFYRWRCGRDARLEEVWGKR